jgi:hypothetical protein
MKCACGQVEVPEASATASFTHVGVRHTSALCRPVAGREEGVQKKLDELNALGKAGAGMVGGTHYKKLEIDPWMVIRANKMGYFDGNALKYIMRYREKDGLQDLQKAKHYLEELIRQEEAKGALGAAREELPSALGG